MAHVPEDHQSFSNLEVFQEGEQDTFKYKVPGYSSEPIALDPHSFPEVVRGHGVPTSHPMTGDKEVVSSPRKRRRLIILGILVGIAVIVGAVVGGVLGSRHSKRAAEDVTPTQDPQSGDPEKARQVLSNSRLAAVNWTSGDDEGVHYRAVFWQANTNDLMASIWESDTHKWTKVNLTMNGTMDVRDAYNEGFIPAKRGTPLAATVRLHTWPKFSMIALFYISEQNTVEQIVTGAITAKTGWGMCCLSSSSNKHIAAKDSQLAAFNVACNGSQCKTDWIHVAYQAASSKIVTLSQAQWSKSTDTTGDDVQMGTGLTMTSTGSPSSNNSKEFVPKLYLQTPKELQEKLWYPNSGVRSRVEGSRTGSDGSPMQLSSAVIPASQDADAGSNNDVLLLSLASDGSQLLINQYTNQTGKQWTGSSMPELTKAPSTFNFTAGALIASPDEPRFVGLESDGTIQSFKISLENTTKWEYEGAVFSD
ncbi:hypothetical protein P171DRAFT_432881 [Karstenula rhodostoma CBS 690.94]|uniref:Fucose-specific lectin n=1 Tax=Karstenula rhodostoma CBS 690.94 TaxID=1392251 RepID=A0A9P4PIR0_9PLEO|nr:hypothetical protein P171DRAFT_432881 [Karstenula rhodostoma CBS 690.94]